MRSSRPTFDTAGTWVGSSFVHATARDFAKFGLLSWFGNLPGDIRIQNERTMVFVPITSMIVLSVVGSVLFNLVSRWFGE